VSLPSSLPDLAGNAALEALADGICTADSELRVTYWNPAAERLFGICRGDALGRPLWALLPGLEEPATRERLARAVGEGAVLSLAVTSDRELFARHLSVHVSPMRGGGVAVHVRDTTGEQRLADQYAQLLESIRDGFIAADREGRIVYVNRAAELLVLLRRDRAIGAGLFGLLPSDPAYFS
jgi:PAS domain S-box-containing protein